ncbi:MAG: hypothetical protein JO062_27740 [Bryobacterales bacterium]|nr:hypothetical protein [Bryobacterales bacterium]
MDFFGRMNAKHIMRTKRVTSKTIRKEKRPENAPWRRTKMSTFRHRTVKFACAAFSAGVVSMLIQPSHAQQEAAQQKAAALKQALANNQAALRQYSWTETTEVSLKGEVKKRQQKACMYGPDGKVQKTPIGDGSPPPQQQSSRRPGGRLKQKLVEKKVDEMQDYMERAVALIQRYIPPDGEKIQAAAKAGNASVQRDPSGGVILIFKNYVQPGDQFILNLDAAGTAIKNMNIASYLDNEKDIVSLAVSFAKLPDGTNYPANVVLDAKAKKITVQMTNSGYRKVAG